MQQKGLNNTATAYVLWLGCLLPICGLHRLYNGKIFTGLLWFCTFGLCGFGQLYDLVLIPKMVDEHNAKLKARYGMLPDYAYQPVVQRVITQDLMAMPGIDRSPVERAIADRLDQLSIKLVKAAHNRGGKLSVTQGVLDVEANFADVEAALHTLVKTGYVDAYNDPETGIVMYEFREL